MTNKNDIAVIGVSFRLPQADTIEDLFNVLDRGLDCTSELPEFRRKDALEQVRKKYKSGKYPIGAYLNEIDKFDYNFFKLSPKEASLMDPNHRLFLENAWHTFEDAGYTEQNVKGTNTGVFVGFKGSQGGEYLNYLTQMDETVLPLAPVGNKPALMAGRLAYLLDLKGPNMLIDTTCSSSLVAVHQACQSLKNSECDMALISGIKLAIHSNSIEEIGINSSDGKTRSFDNLASGAGFGEGVISILLKPLQKSIEDGDDIYAVIKGSAVNHDGASIGVTAPNSNAQADVIVKAWEDARVNPESISYIEAHGTGTKMGDPIEIEGITKAFRKFTNKEQVCGIGTIKSNIGHLDTAAGLAGLLKCLVSIKYKRLFPVANFQNLNENIDFGNTPLYICDKAVDWKEIDGKPRMCGVSSFGMSGTNCHIVIEEFRDVGIAKANHTEGADEIFTVSAKTIKSLREYLQAYKSFLEKRPNTQLRNLCYMTNTQKSTFQYKVAIISNSVADLTNKLTLLLENDTAKYPTFSYQKIYYGDNKRKMRTENDFYGELKSICENYSSSYEIDWKKIYPEKLKKVSLPKYPFEKNRCWVTYPVSNYLHKITWIQKPVVSNNAVFKDQLLLITDSSDFAKKLAEVHGGENITTVLINKDGIGADFDSILEKIDIKHIIFALSVSTEETLNTNTSFILHEVTRKLIRKQNNSLTIHLITSNAQNVKDGERVRPANAALLGYGKVISQEIRNVKIKLIDIDESMETVQLYQELVNYNEDVLVSYRNGVRYIPYIENIELNVSNDSITQIVADKLYIITGGLGGIGLEVAKFLANHRVNIVLLGRSEFISKDKWKEAYQDPSIDSSIKERLSVLLDMELRGSKVEYVQVDVSNYDDLNVTLNDIRSRHGSIHGVIHSAGVAGAGFISNKTNDEMRNVFAPKVDGTINLDILTEEDDLKHFILFSSATTLVGAPGQSDYTAANSFLDSFSAYRKFNGKPSNTINWVRWKKIGMAIGNNFEEDGKFHSISPEEGIKVFEEILRNKIESPHVIVGMTNHGRYTPSSNLVSMNELFKETKDYNFNILVTHKEQVETNTNKSSWSITEKQLIEIWRDLLGTQEITRESDFFELGGHSVMGVQLEIELEKMQLIKENSNISTEIYETSILKDLVVYINDFNKAVM